MFGPSYYTYQTDTGSPLIYILTNLIFFLFGHTDFTARFLTSLAGISALFLVWYIIYKADQKRSKSAGFVVLFLASISPILVYLSRVVSGEMLHFVFALSAIVFALLYWQKEKISHFILCFSMLGFMHSASAYAYYTDFICLLSLVIYLALKYFYASDLKKEKELIAKKIDFILALSLYLVTSFSFLFYGLISSLSKKLEASVSLKLFWVLIILIVDFILWLLVNKLRIWAIQQSNPPKQQAKNKQSEKIEAKIDSAFWRGTILSVIAIAIIILINIYFYSSMLNYMNKIADGLWGRATFTCKVKDTEPAYSKNNFYLVRLALYDPIIFFAGLLAMATFIVRAVLNVIKKRPQIGFLPLFFSIWSAVAILMYIYHDRKLPELLVHLVFPLLIVAGILISGLEGKIKAGWGKVAFIVLIILSLYNIRSGLYLTMRNINSAGELMLSYGAYSKWIKTTTDDIKDLSRRCGKYNQLKIVVSEDIIMPFVWYLREYDVKSGIPASLEGDMYVLIASNKESGSLKAKVGEDYFFTTHPYREWWPANIREIRKSSNWWKDMLSYIIKRTKWGKPVQDDFGYYLKRDIPQSFN